MCMCATAPIRSGYYIRLLATLSPFLSSRLLYTSKASLTYIHLSLPHGAHPIVPPELLIGEPLAGDFLSHPSDMPSAEEHKILYLGVIKSLREEDPVPTAVVRTLRRFDVTCSTVDCEGRGRLFVGELVKFSHHISGQYQGMSFVECAAAECTPAETRRTSLDGPG